MGRGGEGGLGGNKRKFGQASFQRRFHVFFTIIIILFYLLFSYFSCSLNFNLKLAQYFSYIHRRQWLPSI